MKEINIIDEEKIVLNIERNTGKLLKRLFGFKYPKITLLIISIVIAYYLFSYDSISYYISNLGNWGYLSAFIGGLLFSFGFTTPFAIGIFLNLRPENIFLSAFIGGFGAFLCDMIIFKFIKISFMDEIDNLKKIKRFKSLQKIFRSSLNERVKVYLLYLLAGFFIASPFPDEIGVSILAGLTSIRLKVFAIISFVLNTIGIFILLSLS